MKKKVIATLLAGALLGAGAICLSACGSSSVSVPKGDKVTEDKWSAAFEKMPELENYTLKSSMNVQCKLSGTKTEANYYTGKKKDIKVEGNGKAESSSVVLYDKKGKTAYQESSSSSSASGSEDGEKGESKSKYVSKNYYELSETKDSYWRARYSLENSYSSDVESKSERKEEDFWEASETSYFASSSVSSLASIGSFYETNDKDTAVAKSIKVLYSKFTYSGGVYTADLYREVNITQESDLSSIYELVPCTVTVSFDGAQCCVIGLSIKCKGEGNAFKKDNYNIDYTYSGTSIYAVTDIGKTDASKKANKAITKAIDKAKAEKAEANN